MTVAYGKLYVKDKSGDVVQIVPDATASVGEYQGATSQNAGVSGIVPAASTSEKLNFLRGDGTWSEVEKEVALMSETPTAQNTQDLDNGSIIFQQVSQNDSLPIIHSTGTETIHGEKTFTSTITGSVTGNAGTADKVNHDLVLKIKNGTSEGTSKYTFNGLTDKTLNFVQGEGIALSSSANTLTISSTGQSKTYTLCDRAIKDLFKGQSPLDANFEIARVTVKLYSSYDAPEGGSIFGLDDVEYEFDPIFSFTAYNMSIPSNVDYEIEGAFDDFDYEDTDYRDRAIDGIIIEVESGSYDDGGFADIYDGNEYVVDTPGGSVGYSELNTLFTYVSSSFDSNSTVDRWDYACECQQYLESLEDEYYSYHSNHANVKLTYVEPTNPYWNAAGISIFDFSGEEGGSGGGLIYTENCDTTVEYKLNYRIAVDNLEEAGYEQYGEVVDPTKYPNIVVKFTKTPDGKLHCFLNYITMRNSED